MSTGTRVFLVISFLLLGVFLIFGMPSLKTTGEILQKYGSSEERAHSDAVVVRVLAILVGILSIYLGLYTISPHAFHELWEQQEKEEKMKEYVKQLYGKYWKDDSD